MCWWCSQTESQACKKQHMVAHRATVGRSTCRDPPSRSSSRSSNKSKADQGFTFAQVTAKLQLKNISIRAATPSAFIPESVNSTRRSQNLALNSRSPSPELSPCSSCSGTDTWSPLWVMYHAHLNGLARPVDNNPLCFVLLWETLKSNLPADQLNKPSIGPPTSHPRWSVIVTVWLGEHLWPQAGGKSGFIELGSTKGKWGWD